MNTPRQEILCVDDDADTCRLIEYMFKETSYGTSACLTAVEGIDKARKGGYAAIILDNRIAGMSGLEICEKIRLFDSRTPIIFFSGETRETEKRKAIEAGANAYLVKPNDLDNLTQIIIDLIDKSDAAGIETVLY